MRLCRFRVSDVDLFGFYDDNVIIPIDQASEIYSEQVSDELFLPRTEDILELLPPTGKWHKAVRELAAWVGNLEPGLREEIAIRTEDVTLLTPISKPNKLLMLSGNYLSRILEEGGAEIDREQTTPHVFMKPASTTLTPPRSPVILPKISPDHVTWECELGVVIGKSCRRVTEAEALGYVAGYTVVNDVSDRDFRPNPTRVPRLDDSYFDWVHGKWHDTFCPIGPCITSADAISDPQGLGIRLEVNGTLRQFGNTSQMIFPVAAVVSFLSQFVTLEPGDLISTGAPGGVGSTVGGFLRPGDIVRASIDEIGLLENPVVAED